MKNYDYQIRKAEKKDKKRTSIELSPSLQKPVFIITRRLNQSHITKLIDLLEKNKIPFQMQQDTGSLGYTLNHRFFVVVDNSSGEVILGPEFGSLLMTIVGYPKLGRNKKNVYFEKPEQIIKFYYEFKNNSDLSNKTKELLGSLSQDIYKNQIKNNLKIELKSISKTDYTQSKIVKSQLSNIVQSQINQNSSRLIILQDLKDQKYQLFCKKLEQGGINNNLQRASNVDALRKKTLFHTNKYRIIYLINQKYLKEVLERIFIGQIVIACIDQKAIQNPSEIFKEQKIYGIAFDEKELFNLLIDAGVQILHRNNESNFPISYLPNLKIKQDSGVQKQNFSNQIHPKESLNLRAKQSNIALNNINNCSTIEYPIKEISQIANNDSVLTKGQTSQISNLNLSIASQKSSKSHKLKKIKNKSKIKIQKQKQNKEKPQIVIKVNDMSPFKKPILKNEESQINQKSKKNLKFIDNLHGSNKVIKCITKISPQSIYFQSQNKKTMTQYQPYEINQIDKNNNSHTKQSFLSKSEIIHGFFYQQFHHTYKDIIVSLKEQNKRFRLSNCTYQPFLNISEYDKYARRLKRKLKTENNNLNVYNFVVLLEQKDLEQFQNYCSYKNNQYERNLFEMTNFWKDNASCLSQSNSKIHVYLFVQSEAEQNVKVIDFERIVLHKKMIGRTSINKYIETISKSLGLFGFYNQSKYQQTLIDQAY